jgi:hypothetical protein
MGSRRGRGEADLIVCIHNFDDVVKNVVGEIKYRSNFLLCFIYKIKYEFHDVNTLFQ